MVDRVRISGTRVTTPTSGSTSIAARNGSVRLESTQTVATGNLEVAGSLHVTGSITGAVANLSGGTVGSVPYQLGGGSTGFVDIGAAGTVLTVVGGVPHWADLGVISSLSGGTAAAVAVAPLSTATNYYLGLVDVVSGTSVVTGSVALGYSTVDNVLTVPGDVVTPGRVIAESVQIADSVFDSTSTSTNAVLTVVIDSYSIAQYRTAKYLIQIDEGSALTANFQVIEILLLVDNSGTVYATEYGLLTSNGALGEFTADVQSDNLVRLYFTPNSATIKNIKVLRTGMAA